MILNMKIVLQGEYSDTEDDRIEGIGTCLLQTCICLCIRFNSKVVLGHFDTEHNMERNISNMIEVLDANREYINSYQFIIAGGEYNRIFPNESSVTYNAMIDVLVNILRIDRYRINDRTFHRRTPLCGDSNNPGSTFIMKKGNPTFIHRPFETDDEALDYFKSLKISNSRVIKIGQRKKLLSEWKDPGLLSSV